MCRYLASTARADRPMFVVLPMLLAEADRGTSGGAIRSLSDGHS
jgi:hypothetical protein